MNPTCLLDTCALWALQTGGKELSIKTRALLEAPGSVVCVSAISAFEIGQKAGAGKLTLPCDLDCWFPAMLRQHFLTELPVGSDICIAAVALPPIHKDPFDRIIVATARQHGLPIVTSDRVIPSYPGITALW